MKIKLTPLNIISALCLVFAGFMLTDRKPAPTTALVDTTWIVVAFSLLTALVAFISDLIFRKIIPSLGKLWVVQLVLVSFIVILIFIIKASL